MLIAGQTFTVTQSAAVAPSVVSLAPVTSIGASQSFRFQFTHPLGAANLNVLNVLINNRAAALSLCRRRAPAWTDVDVEKMLWAIDSNASMALIAERLDRGVAAVRKKLRDLGYSAESLGGYKVKDVAEMFAVQPARVQYWVAEKMLFTKGGRITESSVEKFLSDYPEKIQFEKLSVDMQKWLREMGYQAQGDKSKVASAGND